MRLPRIIIITVIIFIAVILSPQAAAVENPTSNSSTVTATVPGEPDIPTLISPANNSTINTTSPAFIFNSSLGTIYVDHYQLWLDGSKNTDPIPGSATTITANALAALTEAQHTWFIKALGEYGTTRNSATWTFTIDTTAPLILIDQVAEHQTFLSSLDLTTIPPELTFSTPQRQPIITGQSEANAQLTLIFNNASTTTTLTTTALADNSFSFQPGTNLNPGSYSITLISTDPAGNTTTLPQFTLIILAPTPLLTISLPSPLPILTIPQIKLPFGPQPKLAEILTAFPITPIACSFSLLPWLIILILVPYIFHLLYLNRRTHDIIPFILINQVAEHQTNLSSLDLTTISPELTFTTSQRQPIIAGKSNTNAKLTLILANQLTSFTLTTTVFTDYTFSFQPSFTLSPDTYSIAITSTDSYNRTIILPEFTLTINP